MNIEQIHRMQSDFDSLAQTLPGDGSIEFWFACDLQEPLGYARCENLMTAIQRAFESCETTGYKSEHHFRGVTKMVSLGSGNEFSGQNLFTERLHSRGFVWQGAAA